MSATVLKFQRVISFVKQKKEISLIVVIIGSLFLMAAIVSIIFLVRTINGSATPTLKSVEKLYEKGEPKDVLTSLDKLDPSERGTSASLLMYGKSWYLLSLQKQRDSHWREYAKNDSDWFGGVEADNAVHYLKRAQEDPDSYREATLFLAIVYMEKGWFDQSQLQFEELLSADSSHQEGLLNFGVLLSRKHQFIDAIAMFKRGISCHPKFPQYYENIFWIYALQLNDNENAISFGDRYIKLADKNDVGVISVREQMTDILSRFPEYRNDTLLIIKERARQFEPRN